MRPSRWLIGLLAVTAIAVPVALADVGTAPTPAQAYGVQSSKRHTS